MAVRRSSQDTIRSTDHRGLATSIRDLVDASLPAWYADALCAQTDPDGFFPDKGGSVKQAKMMCQRCEVREQCLQLAMDNGERFGIWGGLSERERRALGGPNWPGSAKGSPDEAAS